MNRNLGNKTVEKKKKYYVNSMENKLKNVRKIDMEIAIQGE